MDAISRMSSGWDPKVLIEMDNAIATIINDIVNMRHVKKDKSLDDVNAHLAPAPTFESNNEEPPVTNHIENQNSETFPGAAALTNNDLFGLDTEDLFEEIEMIQEPEATTYDDPETLAFLGASPTNLIDIQDPIYPLLNNQAPLLGDAPPVPTVFTPPSTENNEIPPTFSSLLSSDYLSDFSIENPFTDTL